MIGTGIVFGGALTTWGADCPLAWQPVWATCTVWPVTSGVYSGTVTTSAAAVTGVAR